MVIHSICNRTSSRIVGNEFTFNDKVRQVYNSITSMLELPREATYQSKYLVDEKWSISNFPQTMKREIYTEYITFLNEPLTEFKETHPHNKHLSYVKKRVSSTGFLTFSYILRILSDKPEERLERRRHISMSEYLHLLVQADPMMNDITRQASAFIYKNSIFTLETDYVDNKKQYRLLRVNSKSKTEPSLMPDFLPVKEDITSRIGFYEDEERFFSQNCARKSS